MSGPSRTKIQRERSLAVIEKLDNRGYSQLRIRDYLAENCGIDISRVQVCVDVKKIRQRYLNQADEDAKKRIERMLRNYAEVRAEAWESWERSKKQTSKHTVEMIPVEKDEDEEPRRKKGKAGKPKGKKFSSAVESMRKLREIWVREGRLPANQYLAIILDTLKAERELLGLDAAAKLDITATTFDWNTFFAPPPADPVSQRLNAEDGKPMRMIAAPVAEPGTNGKHVVVTDADEDDN